MKLSVMNVVMLGVGGILVYSGIKAYNPRDVILWGLGGKKPSPFNASGGMGDLGKPQDMPPELGGPQYPGDMGLPDGEPGVSA